MKHRPKIYFKKSRKFLKAKLEFALHQELFIFISEFTIYCLFQNLPCVYNHLHRIYIVLGIILISNLEISLSIWEDMCRLYANTTWFCIMSLSICMGSWSESPGISRDNCILFSSFLTLHILLATSVFSMTLTTMYIWIFPNFIFPAWMTIVFSIVLDNQDADRHHLDISLNLQFVQVEFVSFLFVSFWLTVPLCT